MDGARASVIDYVIGFVVSAVCRSLFYFASQRRYLALTPELPE